MFGGKRPNNLIYGSSISDIDAQINKLNIIKNNMIQNKDNLNLNLNIQNKDSIVNIQNKNKNKDEDSIVNIQNKDSIFNQINQEKINSVTCRILMDAPGIFFVENDTFLFNEENEEVNMYQIYFQLKNIKKTYYKKYIQNILTLEIPMKKNGNIIMIIINVDLSQTDIINCNYTMKIV